MALRALEADDTDSPELRLVKAIARSNFGRARRAEDHNSRLLAEVIAKLDRIEKALEEFE